METLKAKKKNGQMEDRREYEKYAEGAGELQRCWL